MSPVDTRGELIAVAQALDAAGMVPNKSGNVSSRTPTGFVITPAGVPYAELDPGILVALRLDGVPEAAGLRPSRN